MPVTPLSPLRSLTRDEHAAVDLLYSRFDLSETAGYRAFLEAQASAHLVIEDAIDSAGSRNVVRDWAERRRAPHLRADLADLGVRAPSPAAAPPQLRTEAALLGAIYVLEGSRLGGAVLAPRVKAGLPVRFLTARPAPGAWRSLLALLDDRLASAATMERAAETARACFRCFEQTAILQLEPGLA